MNKTTTQLLSIEQLRPFQGHPFKVIDNEEMDQLVESITAQGVLTPLVVRPLETGGYEVISGHRRLHACKKAGVDSVPAVITDMDRDTAAIALVDSNLHREHILPSEKAFAYKLKMDALKQQGLRTDLTSSQVATKLDSATEVGKQQGDSRDTVFRYIRLTHLIPEILQMVDDRKIALTPAVDISYLTQKEQADLLETMECEDCTPSVSQAIRMKQLSQAGELDIYTIFDILTQKKANQHEKISFKVSDLRGYFPRSYTASQMTRDILKALELLRQRREQNRDTR